MTTEKSPQRIKSSDINIYGDLENESKPSPSSVSSTEPLFLQEYTSIARKGVSSVLSQYKVAKERLEHIVETGKAHTSSSLVTLREEENLLAQIAVITAGSFLGYLVGITRGRFMKRSFYTTLGFTGSYALCYPEKSKNMATEYGNVAYHFVDGVVKEDLADVVQAVKDMITVPPSKDSEDPKK